MCQLITCSLVSCLTSEPLMPFSSCESTREIQRKKKMYYAFVDLEKTFDRVPREVVRWALRKLDVDEWLTRSVMALYTEACTVVRTYAGLSESFGCWSASRVRTCCCCRPHPSTDNGGGVQQPFLRTPADDIPHLASIQPAGIPPSREPSTNS